MSKREKLNPVGIGLDSIKRLAIFLEGVKLGGGLGPLGNRDLEELWTLIQCLEGEAEFISVEVDKRDKR